MGNRVVRGLLIIIAANGLTFAQIGYPGGGYPGGGYPPGGRYPGGSRYPRSGGPNLPFPGRGKKDKAKTKKGDTQPADLQTVKGTLRRLDDDVVFLTADDSRQIEFVRTANTKFYRESAEAKPEVFQPGDHILVECSRDEEGYFTAVNLYHEKEGTPEERSVAARQAAQIERSPVGVAKRKGEEEEDRPRLKRAGAKEEPATAPAGGTAGESASAKEPAAKQPQAQADPEPTIARNDNIVREEAEPDPNRPRLQRGRATRRPSAESGSDSEPVTIASTAAGGRVIEVSQLPPIDQVARNTPPKEKEKEVLVEPERPQDERIVKASERAVAFTETLPSYVCQQHIARYVSTTTKVDWHALDLVSTEVVYENGKEQYRNLKVNGKPVSKKMEQLDGAWSTGEFGTVLRDLFSPATRAYFRPRGGSRAGNRMAYRYDFEVDQDNSHWTIMTAGQSVRPSYRGAVWIDQENYGVLRIEMQTRNMPQAFPLDKAESAVDYEVVRIGERQYLLPVHAETLSCVRGTSNCSRNVLDFRNYHRYSGESTITFENK